MNLQQLKCIVEIARAGSITKAAEALYMNQPNLSRTIIDFENEYGVTLFVRNSHGVSLTDDGQKIVEEAEKIINSTNDLESFLLNNDKDKVNLKVSVPRASYISCAFCDTVSALDKHKDLNIVFKETNNNEIINDVAIHGFNLGILRVPSEVAARFKKQLSAKKIVYQEIWNFKCNIVFSAEHPLASKDAVTLDDLKEYSVIMQDGEYVPFISNDEMKKHILSADAKSKILIKERGSQFDILSTLPRTYMWVTPIPDYILKMHNLVMKRCVDNEQSFIDILIHSKEHQLNEFEKEFVKNIYNLRYELGNM